ncbi:MULTISPECIES: fructosamine kinase family protein [Thermomonospora]|uniref:Fructosamine kinase n=1 Tax=Thermomonospora curvata (strain ATCC 19995 / DSM 43183 / JCM 3096 / KCTC 9072 / NBRC 15933 / NCIMB 10081 / Henssen B9) TaxID=471852 RepID=D1A583_THECD|nr:MULTISPECIES: fructosamine kinase family protein [Thermomonospora]ACZ00069.1 fructosamine kinase [Thermomonospora curvata DSM 43183]PKK11902.1 MAG: fructosamine kinase [Thermomonospora sp. CIF 1]
MDRRRLERLTGAAAEQVTALGTGHAWSLWRVRLADGRQVFVKAADDRPGLFAAEATGLRWLAEGAGHAAPVPEVIAVDDHMLVLPWLPAEPPSPQAAERFGRELAALHAGGADSFGAPWQGFIARLPLDNTPADRWPRWYAERRIAPYLRLAARHLDRAEVGLVERVMAEIETLAGPEEPPARIHGDLWSGNVLWSGGRAWLIDPAAHGGHRETDLAMLALFGAPYLDRILDAYREVHPLAEGWRARVPLHQLHPLLVHVALFGPSYRGAAVEAARAALRASR